jgi:hypothetical protein
MLRPRPKPFVCRACRIYFARFSCGASRGLECDCPKCQGLCACPLPPQPKLKRPTFH